MQELMWAGVKVAVLSGWRDADSGGHPGKRRVPAGCVHIASQVSNLPAALRCGLCPSSSLPGSWAPPHSLMFNKMYACRAAAGKLGVLLCHALVHLAQALERVGTGLDNLPLHIVQGSHVLEQACSGALRPAFSALPLWWGHIYEY